VSTAFAPAPAAPALALARLPWISVAPGAPYFVDEDGLPWHPIGQNDAITWPELAPLYRRRDLPAVERHLRWLRANGVTCLRLMLEYAQGRHRYFERPTGRFVPAMVQLWDDLFELCERVGLRILLTPLDTFWTWIKWRHHPWNKANGGPLDSMSRALLCQETRAALKARFEFAVRRWGGSGALFAWDLWNEIHPAHAQDSADCFGQVIHDLSAHVRTLEQRLYGRSHPQTVSIYGPELRWRSHVDMREPILRHPDLDFATIHIYKERSIDDPRDTVAPAVAMGSLVAECIAETPPERPFLDTEHGPIHAFKDRRITLPEPFDDEYFRHTAWAHLASGGAGGGMRWPNRSPHVLTGGMREAQRAMAAFIPLIDWTGFRRRTWNQDSSAPGFHAFACGDERQAVVWLLRRGALGDDGMMRPDLSPTPATLKLPLMTGPLRVVEFDTRAGTVLCERLVQPRGEHLRFTTAPITGDRALAIRALT
jgi:mannan endo-1,4-beta-mannosidase